MRKVFYKKEDGWVLCALFEEGELTRFYRLPDRPKTGSILLGKVKFVHKGSGIFVDIGLERDGILPFRPGLKSGDSVLVKVETEPQEERGCSLTEKISLAGKYAVLTTGAGAGFSKNIPEERKKQLSALTLESYGCIFRSYASEGEVERIEKELDSLKKTFGEVLRAAKTATPITVLYEENAMDVVERLADEVVCGFDKETEKAIKELQERKIVRDGVELVFEKTEAMTVVDVNFHASSERGERAAYHANVVAIKEFSRQLRLRNIGGLIALDYISVRKEEGEKLYSLIKEELKKDYLFCQVEQAEKAGVFIVIRAERYSS